MARMNLKSLSFDELLDLRERVDEYVRGLVTTIRADLQGKLARVDKLITPLGRSGKVAGVKRRKSLKGRKLPPKYRNPKKPSETWAGRGATPLWLRAQLREGKKLDEFAIEKVAGKAKAKPARRKKR
jgi:DNA-binding protein H-NS